MTLGVFLVKNYLCTVTKPWHSAYSGHPPLNTESTEAGLGTFHLILQFKMKVGHWVDASTRRALQRSLRIHSSCECVQLKGDGVRARVNYLPQYFGLRND